MEIKLTKDNFNEVVVNSEKPVRDEIINGA